MFGLDLKLEHARTLNNKDLYNHYLKLVEEVRRRILDCKLKVRSKELLEEGPSEEEWAKNPMPLKPLKSKVKFQKLRAASTFLIPAAIIAGTSLLTMDIKAIAIAAPFAVLGGALNHRKLLKDMLYNELAYKPTPESLRYDYFKFVSETLPQIKAEQLTFRFVKAQAKGFATLMGRGYSIDRWAKYPAERAPSLVLSEFDPALKARIQEFEAREQAAERARTNKNNNPHRNGMRYPAQQGQRHAPYQNDEFNNPGPIVNIDGTPMAGGGVDVRGRPYGAPVAPSWDNSFGSSSPVEIYGSGLDSNNFSDPFNNNF